MEIIIENINETDLKYDDITNIELKKQDIIELGLLGFNDTKSVLDLSIKNSKEVSVISHPKYGIIGVFGLSYTSKDKGSPWLLTTKDIKYCWYDIAKYSKKIINENYLNKVDLLYNIIDKNNKISIKYLKYIGFKFEEYEPDNRFYLFYMKKGEKKCVVQ